MVAITEITEGMGTFYSCIDRAILTEHVVLEIGAKKIA